MKSRQRERSSTPAAKWRSTVRSADRPVITSRAMRSPTASRSRTRWWRRPQPCRGYGCGRSTAGIIRCRAWGDGDERALERLMPLVYEELHQAAHRYMAREAPDHTLQTTALVNEVYLRLAGVRRGTWKDRAHFFALCAKLMRRILIDFARGRSATRPARASSPTPGSLPRRSKRLRTLRRCSRSPAARSSGW